MRRFEHRASSVLDLGRPTTRGGGCGPCMARQRMRRCQILAASGLVVPVEYFFTTHESGKLLLLFFSFEPLVHF